MLFEPLEPRFLLSADLLPVFDVDMATDGDDLTLRLDQISQNLQVLDNKNNLAVVKQRALSEIDRVDVTGTAFADRLTVDFDQPFSLIDGVHFDGGGGADQLDVVGGPADSVRYTVDGADSGEMVIQDAGATVNRIVFSGLAGLSDRIAADTRALLDGTARAGRYVSPTTAMARMTAP